VRQTETKDRQNCD